MFRQNFSVNFPVSSSCIKYPKLFITRSSTQTACATGWTRRSLSASMGEMFERCWSFSNLVNLDNSKILQYNQLDIDLQEYLSLIFNFDTTKNISINCTIAQRSLSNNIIYVPQLFCTLGAHQDDNLFPYRDSSGIAFHTNLERAKASSLNEFAERQSLTAFWYFNHYNKWMYLNGHKFTNLQISALIESLTNSNGVLIAINTSIFKEIHSFLVLYFNQEQSPYYASGGAAHKDPTEALNKAILECYQSIILMSQITSSTSITATSNDPLIDNYKTYNTPDAFSMFKLDNSKNVLSFHDLITSSHANHTIFDDNIFHITKTTYFSLHDTCFLVKTGGINWFPFMSAEYDVQAFQKIAHIRELGSMVRQLPIPFS